MGTTASTGNDSSGLVEFLEGVRGAYEQMEMPVGRYLLLVVTPAVALFGGTVVGSTMLPLPGVIQGMFVVFGGFVLAVALLYPRVAISSRRSAIDKRLHLVLTHMTLLSTTNIDRMTVFRTIADESEYGPAATELSRVVHLVDMFNLSLDEACRQRAKRVPSNILADFLDRLAYSLESGQELSDFLLTEQEVVIRAYVTYYEGTFENLEVMKELYLSMILSMTFGLVFATVLPILTGNDPTTTIAAVLVMFVFVQLGFAYAIRTLVPFDPVWFHPEETSERVRELQLVYYGSFAATVAAVAFTAAGMYGLSPVSWDSLWPGGPMPQPLYVAVPVTPLFVGALALRAEESRIVARDEAFPSFIRALGASEATKQATTTAVLRTLRQKDFGPLTPDIDRLYSRLNFRIDPTAAWHYFVAEARSYLIQKFSEMYLVGRALGGDPKLLGELISENMSEVNNLRKLRRQLAVTFVGILYGITASATFAFFMGLEVVRILSVMSDDMAMENSQVDVQTFIHTGVYNIPLIEFLLLAIVLFNALLSAYMIRVIDGGNQANATFHFVLLTWVGALTAVLTRVIIRSLLTL
jgi:flagellar protein FlaJ